MTHEHTVALLNELIQTSHDGEKGFAKAAREVADPQLKSLFVEASMRCREGARELEHQVRALGLEPTKGGSLAGAVHRGWLELKSLSTSRNTRAILEECERGEDYAKARYAQVLGDADLIGDLRVMIERQNAGVIHNHERIRSLRESYPL